MTKWFSDVPVAGALSDDVLSEKLGEPVAMPRLDSGRSTSDGRFAFDWMFGVPAWRHTSHSFGFIPAGASRSGAIQHVGEIAPDPGLRNARLRISLDALPVEIPAVERALPDSSLVPVFASLIPQMIVPYADAAALMLANLDRGNAMSRHRVGLASSDHGASSRLGLSAAGVRRR